MAWGTCHAVPSASASLSGDSRSAASPYSGGERESSPGGSCGMAPTRGRVTLGASPMCVPVVTRERIFLNTGSCAVGGVANVRG